MMPARSTAACAMARSACATDSSGVAGNGMLASAIRKVLIRQADFIACAELREDPPSPTASLTIMPLFRTRRAALYDRRTPHRGGGRRERIKSALLNSGFGCPDKSVTVNLAPADLRREGAGFDLPMAAGIPGAMGGARGG